MVETVTALVGGHQIIIETGKLANQADGAVTVRLGETIVLVAAVAASKAKPGQDFFPLTVDYREKAAAAGKFPGGYFKREGRPTEKEILTSRLTDRPIRPLFPKGWFNEVQVQSVLLSADGENDSDILTMIGASAALAVSDIPYYTLTERLEELHLDEVELAAQIPARRLGRSRDFAALAAFLASDQAGYVTGQAIACDGGLLQSI